MDIHLRKFSRKDYLSKYGIINVIEVIEFAVKWISIL